jgi:Ca-activated chloride channel family protein
MKVSHKIANVVLLMDVSNSMNAEDVQPDSRLDVKKDCSGDAEENER